MSWVKIDDGFPEHPKIAAMGEAGPHAGWLFVAGNCYASRNLTDGFIPSGTVPRLALFPVRVKAVSLAGELVRVGLWEDTDGGYQIHDYLVYNPSRVSVLAQRARWTDNARVRRESHVDSTMDSKAESQVESRYPVPLPRPVSASKEALNPRDGLPNLTPEAIRLLEESTRYLASQAGDKQLTEYDRLVGAHGLEKIGSAFGRLNPNGEAMTARQLVWAAVKVLEPFPDSKAAAAAEREQAASESSRRGVEATIRNAHRTGFHEATADPRCPLCREGAA